MRFRLARLTGVLWLAFIVGPNSAHAQIASRDSLAWQKLQLEQVLLDRLRSSISPVLAADKYLINVRVDFRQPSESSTRESKPASPEAQSFLEDSVLLSKLGLEQDVFAPRRPADAPLQALDLFDFVTRMSVSIALDSSVPDIKAEAVKKLATSVLAGVANLKPQLEVLKLPLVDPPPPEPQKPTWQRVLDWLKEFAVPLGCAILALGALIHLLVAKRLPSWKEMVDHELMLERIQREEASKRKSEEDAKRRAEEEANRPPPIDDVSEFRKFRELSERLMIQLRGLDIHLVNALIESWFSEGEPGLKKCVHLARIWNEVRADAPMKVEAAPELVQLFKKVGKSPYGERNKVLEDVLYEVAGAQTIGVEAFRERFGFLMVKPREVQIEAVRQLANPSDQAQFLTSLPEDKRLDLLGGLDASLQSELIYAAMLLKKIPEEDLDRIADQIRYSLEEIENRAGRNRTALDVSERKIAYLDRLPADQEIRIVSELKRRNGNMIEWLKSRYFGASMLPYMSDAALADLTRKLTSEELANLCLAFEPEFGNRAVGLVGELKSAVVGDLLRLARQNNRLPEWGPVDRWVRDTRKALKERKNFIFLSLYDSYDGDAAKKFENVGFAPEAARADTSNGEPEDEGREAA